MLLTYAGEPDRYYPTLGITPAPGAEYELAVHPSDGRWLPEPEPAATTEAEAEAASEPTAPARRRTKKEATDA